MDAPFTLNGPIHVTTRANLSNSTISDFFSVKIRSAQRIRISSLGISKYANKIRINVWKETSL